ncbi:hypothetical protein PR202_gb29588 [Eleusine coracana subsp. coracana]|uniref:Uncharacterized protein n=1 Tax=Eleusine coracana subsp. coracana TaxID=191504 RepID=A0AAV5G1Z8_ELECO|nr:hypothetical protein PR202_gb29588 [Eleusine coracana subsp. coracana]
MRVSGAHAPDREAAKKASRCGHGRKKSGRRWRVEATGVVRRRRGGAKPTVLQPAREEAGDLGADATHGEKRRVWLGRGSTRIGG